MGLFDLFSNKSAENAARLANEGSMRGLQQLGDLYGQGRAALDTNYGKAENVLQGATDFFKGGAEAYGDVAGAHGVEGLQRATDLYRNSGQYGMFGVANDAAQQALNRQMAAGGRGNSGNANFGAMKTANDLALGGWGQFQQGLLPYMSAYGNAETNLANLYPGWGQSLNTSFTGQGNAANTSATQQGQNLAGAEMNKYQVGANQLNAIMGVAKLAAGGAGGLGGGLSSLFSGFGGGGGSIPQTANLGTSFQHGQYIPTYY